MHHAPSYPAPARPSFVNDFGTFKLCSDTAPSIVEHVSLKPVQGVSVCVTTVAAHDDSVRQYLSLSLSKRAAQTVKKHPPSSSSFCTCHRDVSVKGELGDRCMQGAGIRDRSFCDFGASKTFLN